MAVRFLTIGDRQPVDASPVGLGRCVTCRIMPETKNIFNHVSYIRHKTEK
jgi:hypothetical protein